MGHFYKEGHPILGSPLYTGMKQVGKLWQQEHLQVISAESRVDRTGSTAPRPRGSCATGSPGSKATPSLLDEGSGSGGIVGQSQERKSTHTLTSLASACQTGMLRLYPATKSIYCQAALLCYKSGPCPKSLTSFCTWSGFSEHSSNPLKFCRGRPAGPAFLSSQEGQRASC